MRVSKQAMGIAPIMALVIGPWSWPAAAVADILVVGAAKDNTLYRPDPDFPDDLRSNGAGEYFFVGLTARGDARRGLVAFDIAGALPEGAIITRVELTLHMSRTPAEDESLSLHALLAGWGEGPSDAPKEEGMGAPAEPGDATWKHRFFDTDLWTTEGGDFSPTASALFISYWLVTSPLFVRYSGRWLRSSVGVMIMPAA